MDWVVAAVYILAALFVIVSVWWLRRHTSTRERSRALRNLGEVIDQIIREIPGGEYVALKRELRNIQGSAPAELMPAYWNEVDTVLQNRLGNPISAPWKQKISAIMRGEKL